MGYAFKLLISVALVAGLLHFLDVGSALRQLAAAEPGYAVAGMAGFALVHAINAVKLNVVLPDRRVPTLLAFILVAQAYSLVLPGQIASEAVKAYRLARDTTGRATGQATGRVGRVVSSVAFDKMTSLVALMLTTFTGLVLEADRFGSGLFVAAGAALALLVGVAGLLALGGLRRLAEDLRAGAGWRARVGGHLWNFLDAWRFHAAQPWSIARSLFYGIAGQFLQAAAAVLLCRGLGVEVSFALWCVIIGVLTVLLLAPVTIGGLGLREASLVGMLGLSGVDHDHALAVAFAILGFQILVTVVGLLVDLLVLRGRPAADRACPANSLANAPANSPPSDR